MKRKLLATLLTLCMLLSVVPMMGLTAGAATYDDGTFYFITNANGTATVYPSDDIAVTDITIPSSVTYKGVSYPVTVIGSFMEAEAITSVTIPDSVSATIDVDAFSDLTNLQSVSIGNGITEIGYSAFSGCSSLKTVTIGSGIDTLPSGCFMDTGLVSVNIPDNVTSIIGAFVSCPNLTSVTLGKNIKYISSSAFEGSAIYNDDKNWDNGLFYIGDYLIVGDWEDEHGGVTGAYVVKAGTKLIADSAFSGCSEMTSVTLPDSLKYINSYAFNCCYGLESITIPASVKEIGAYAFSYCGMDSLDDITFETDDINSISINQLSVDFSLFPTTTQTGSATVKLVGYNNNVEVNGNVRNGQLLKPVVTGYEGTDVLYYQFGADASNTKNLTVSETSDMDKAGDMESCDYICRNEGYAAVKAKAVLSKLTCNVYQPVLDDSGKLSFNLIAKCEYDNPMCANASTTTTGDTEELQAELDEKNVLIMHLGDEPTSLVDLLQKNAFIHLTCANVKFSSVSRDSGTSVNVAGTDKNATITPVSEGLSKISFQCYTSNCLYHGTAGKSAAKLTAYRYVYVVDDLVSTSAADSITVTDNTSASAVSTYRIGMTDTGSTTGKQTTFTGLQCGVEYDVVQDIALEIGGETYTGSYHNYISTVKSVEYSASLTLNENIDINFSIKNLADTFDKKKLSIKVNGTAISNANIKLDDTTASCVLKSVNPAEMDTELNVVVTYDGTQLKAFTYSVADYCEAVFAAYANNNATYDKLNTLCKALLNYGKWATDYANEQANGAGNYVESTLNADCPADLSVIQLPASQKAYTNTTEDITGGVSLQVGSDIALQFTLTTTRALTADDVVVTNNLNQPVSPKNITFAAVAGGYTVSIENFGASKLSRNYTLQLKDVPAETFSVSYGVYSYCTEAQSFTAEQGFSDTMKTLCKAIYAYAEAAKAYAE